MLLSIVIVNWNTGALLQNCLNSIRANAPEMDLEIIIVDNNSHDGSAHNLAWTDSKRLRVIYSKENLGFAKGTNLGLSKATGDYILLLNPDTLVHEHALQKSISYLRDNPDVGAISPRYLDEKGRFREIGRGTYPSVREFFLYLWKGTPFGKSPINPTAPIKIEWTICAYLMLRRKVLEKVGLLDAAFVMFGDDMDYSYRIKKAGYKLMLDPSIIITHFSNQSARQVWGEQRESNSDLFKLYRYANNIFIKKHYNFLDRFLLLYAKKTILLCCMTFTAIFFFLTRRQSFKEKYWRAASLLRQSKISKNEYKAILNKAGIRI